MATPLSSHPLFFAKIVPFVDSHYLHQLRVCTSWNEKVKKLVTRLSFYDGYRAYENIDLFDDASEEEKDHRHIRKLIPFMPAWGLICELRAWSKVQRLSLLVRLMKPHEALEKALVHCTRLTHLKVTLCAADVSCLCALPPGILRELRIRCPGCLLSDPPDPTEPDSLYESDQVQSGENSLHPASAACALSTKSEDSEAGQADTSLEIVKKKTAAAQALRSLFKHHGGTLTKVEVERCYACCDNSLPCFEGEGITAHSTSVQIRKLCPFLDFLSPAACHCGDCRTMFRNSLWDGVREGGSGSDLKSESTDGAGREFDAGALGQYLEGRGFDCEEVSVFGTHLSQMDWSALQDTRLSSLRALDVSGFEREETNDYEGGPTNPESIERVCRQNPNLQYVSLKFTDGQILRLCSFAQNLVHIDWFCQSFTEEVWREIGRCLTSLRVMTSGDCDDLTDSHMNAWAEGIKESGKPSKVRVLHHFFSGVTFRGLAASIGLSDGQEEGVRTENLCPELQSVILGNDKGQLTPEGLRAWGSSGVLSFEVNIWMDDGYDEDAWLDSLKGFLRGSVRLSLQELSLKTWGGGDNRVVTLDDEALHLLCRSPSLTSLSLGTVQGVTLDGWTRLMTATAEKQIRLRHLSVGSDTKPDGFDPLALPFFPPLFPPPPSPGDLLREEEEKREREEKEQERQQKILHDAAEKVQNLIRERFLDTVTEAAAESKAPTGAAKKNAYTSPFKSLGQSEVRVGILAAYARSLIDELVKEAFDDLTGKEHATISKQRRIEWRQEVRQKCWEVWRELEGEKGINMRW